MENLARFIEYKTEKEQAWSFYKSIGQLWCPMLGEFVIFNRLGFQHLVRQKNMKRATGEQRRRFALLGVVKNAIEDPNASPQLHRKPTVRSIKVNKEKKRVPSYADFWEFTVHDGGKIIKVIVRQFPDGRKHFLSVYEKKRKSLSS
jgi:hypothetical protein